jgi:acyl transferase domain-containing protein/NADPH-dependent curcumin reductase CurA/acyl carrier protein
MKDTELEILQKAVKEIELQKLKIKSLENKNSESIAVIGLSCRFPGGADTPEAFWELLKNGLSTSIDVPQSRWDIDAYYDPIPDTPGKMISRKSSFITAAIDEFDANFFKISPKEAEYLDPQQRLLLEVTWEALEDARIIPSALVGSNTGVFIGIASHDYEDLIAQAENNKVNAYLASGNMGSTASGRLSYTLGLQGPSVAIDTACSSSLVALHNACQSLHLGESNMAIAGGVNLILSPMLNINFSQAHMLAADGYCKTFDANADGYVRGEGCGIIILKRLSDAIRDNDKILAVIKGSAVNQDGASSGLTVPNGPAQEEVIKRALAQAKLTPDEIDYIEAHGTGTALGDPIEINAIYNVFKNPARKNLTIGTVKTNIGHLEAAAGIAGVIKTILALQHETIPKHLHFSERNPQIIDFNDIPAQLPLNTIEWPKEENHLRRAGVSSFAFSGTNAHVILEEAPQQDESQLRPALPKTEFHRQRYWAEALSHSINKNLIGEEINPLLGLRIPDLVNHDDIIFEQNLSLKKEDLHYLSDHQVFDNIIFPGAAFVELLLAATKSNDNADTFFNAIELKNITIEAPLKLDAESNILRIQTVVAPERNGLKHISIYSQHNEEENDWQLHARGEGMHVANLLVVAEESIDTISARCAEKVDVVHLYKDFASRGITYGTAFQTIKQIQYTENELLAKIETDAVIDSRQLIYPPILDGAMQTLLCLFSTEEKSLYLPVSFDNITLYQTLPTKCYVHATITTSTPDMKIANFTLLSESGAILAKIQGFKVKQATKTQLEKRIGGVENIAQWYYAPQWQSYKLMNAQSQESSTIYFDAREKSNVITSRSAARLLNFLQEQINQNTNIIIVTEQAYALAQEPINLNQAMLNGLIKTAILEHPEIKLRQLDVAIDQDIEPLLLALGNDLSNEQLFIYRAGEWYVERVESYKATETNDIVFDKNASYLITGGLGGLGLVLAQYLAEHNAGRIILVSRKLPDADTDALIKSLQANDTQIVTYQADISHQSQVEELITFCHDNAFPLKGIFHLAGIIEDAPLEKQTAQLFAHVFAPKALGAWYLHEITQAQQIPLEHFVLFSSIASLQGSLAQSNYATANSFLDGLATYRHQQGLAALSLNWGPWAEVGMAKNLVALHTKMGYIPLKTNQALTALTWALNQTIPQLGIIHINKKRISEQFSYIPSWLSTLIDAPQESALLKMLQESPAAERESLLKMALTQEIKKVLGLSASHNISETAGFFELGMDSLMAVETRNRLQALIGNKQRLPMTWAFENPTIAKMSEKLLPMLDLKAKGQQSQIVVQNTQEPMAIIGMACRFPHGANSLEAFWEILEKGEDCIEGIPKSRWDVDSYYSDDLNAAGKMYTRMGGFLNTDISLFDAAFFNISPKEAELMDPQQRLLLEVVWEALEDAAVDATTLKERPVGFFLGQMNNDYMGMLLEHDEMGAYVGSGTAPSAAAGRVSYILGLQGPAMAIDTACSSSLVALNSAIQSMREGESEISIVAGVNLMLYPKPTIQMCQAKMLSPEGHCKTFDESADGYTRGEGCGVLILKPLSKALQDHNKVWAIIRGSGVNEGGPSSGLTVPNASAQEKVIRFALAKAGLTPEDIDYLEAHGTGTKLGDPIEIRALAQVFGERTNKDDKTLIVSSVKTYLGHLESAAGVAGIIKTVLSMNHDWIPKHLHLNHLNPAISLEELHGMIPVEGIQWPKTGKPKRAGVSSFGFSGINAHVVIEEAPIKDNSIPPNELLNEEHLLLISAKTESALENQIKHYLEYLKTTKDAIYDICYTSQVGRVHFENSIAVTGKTIEDLINNIQNKNYVTQIEPYRYYQNIKKYFNIVSMPSYSFERKRFWAQALENNIDQDASYFEWKSELVDPMQQALDATKGKWVIFSDKEGVGDALDEIFRENNLSTVCVREADKWETLENGNIKLNVSLPESAEQLQDYLSSKEIAGIIYCWNTPINSALEKMIFEKSKRLSGRLWIITSDVPSITEQLVQSKDLALVEFSEKAFLNKSIPVTIVGLGSSSKPIQTAKTIFKELAATHPARYIYLGKRRYILSQSKSVAVIVPIKEKITVSESTISKNSSIDILREKVLTVLGLEISKSYDSKGFFELGLDSLMAAELSTKMRALFPEVPPSATLFFDYPTIEKLSVYIDQMQSGNQTIKEPISNPLNTPEDAIAIIGMSCRFPGGGNNPEEFWQNLSQGLDAGSPIPNDRWNMSDYFSENVNEEGKIYVNRAALLTSPITDFDADFFEISPREAIVLDPQQRLLLEVTWEALEHANIVPKNLENTSTGVFVGIYSTDFRDILFQNHGEESVEGYLATGNAGSTASGRISYSLGLQGPSMSIDTACSSAMVAIHQACQSLQLGESSIAIAGGVNVILSPDPMVLECSLKMLSAEGECKTFDKDADGFMRGEGCGIIILKRLSEAKRDNDNILAVIRGSAVNQDGASSGLTVPNGPAQEAVIRRALNQAKLTPDDIDYIEAHGTGTPLGDPIEVNALSNVFGAGKNNNTRTSPLIIGTVKTNIGHLEAAAGIAGVIKTILALQKEEIPRHLHFAEINPKIIDLTSIPAKIPLKAIPWHKTFNHIRRAGISSFAFSGTNAHLVIEEAPEQKDRAIPTFSTQEHLLIISAKNETSLQKQIANYLNYLKATKEEIYDICYISQVARTRFENQVAVTGKTIEELIQNLQNKNYVAEIAPYIYPVELESYFKKVTLPTYAFQKERYWPNLQSHKAGMSKEVHPLLGVRLTSVAGQDFIAYEKTLDINDAKLNYIKDHQIFDTLIFPAAGFIEQMLAGVTLNEEVDWALQGIELSEIAIELPLKIGQSEASQMQSIFSKENIEIYSQQKNSNDDKPIFQKHIKAINKTILQPSLAVDKIDEIKSRMKHEISCTEFYDKASQKGFHYGATFQLIKNITANENEAFAEIEIPYDNDYLIYPPVLDACLHTTMALLESDNEAIYLPTGFDKIGFYQKVTGNKCFAHVDLDRQKINVLAENGQLLASIEGFQFKEITKGILEQVISDKTALEDFCYTENLLQYEFTTASSKETSLLANSVTFDARFKSEDDKFKLNAFSQLLVFLKEQIIENDTNKEIIIISNVTEETHALSAFVKTAILEYPDLPIYLIDTDAQDVESLLSKISSSEKEQIIIFRNEQCFVPRISKLIESNNLNHKLTIPQDDYCLIKDGSSLLSGLNLTTNNQLIEPKENEVVIQPKSVGLNFRDVLNVMNLYPGDPGPLGNECSGQIVAIGKNVNEFAVGDEVFGIAGGSFASKVATNKYLIAKKPNNLTNIEAATIPIAFLTAYYGLVEIAKIKQGDTILIHAAAGGVGLAAIQIAQQAQATIIATVGSEEKKQYLRNLGIKHIFDSRSLNFAQDIAQLLQTKGVDIVLNSLSGEGFIQTSLDCCAPNARFIEIGKRDIWSNDKVAQYRPDINYQIIAIDTMVTETPEVIHDLFTKVVSLINQKIILPLPNKVFSLHNAIEAFEYLQQAHNIGKIVIELPALTPQFNKQASYLITGGLGGIGLELARYLAEHGAGRIILNARKKPNDSAKNLIKELQQTGVKIDIAQGDISDVNQVSSIIDAANNKEYPLKGIFHTAGIISDAPLDKQTSQNFEEVFAPKAKGAWNLHETCLNKNIILDHFVLFSSIASLNGSPAQINYATANGFLDDLAHYRKQHNLNALSINWGPWEEVGMAKDLVLSHKRQGVTPFKTMLAMQLLSYALKQDITQLGIININWQKNLENVSALPSWLIDLVEAKQKSVLLEQLQAAPAEQKKPLLQKALLNALQQVLNLSNANMVREDKGFFEMGMDSLMALEFKNRIQFLLNIHIANSVVFDYPNLQALTDYLMSTLKLTQAETIAKPEVDESLNQLKEEIENLSLDEITNEIDAIFKENGEKE